MKSSALERQQRRHFADI